MIKVSYATMEAMGMLVKRLGQDARRLEKALAETMNASAEWKRIAEEMKKERNALRAATIDTAAGSLLDAFGSLANEPRNGSPDDKYHVRIVTKIHAIKLDRDALRKERDDLRTQLATERERYKQKTVDVPRAHPVKVGEYVKNDNGDVCQVHEVYAEYLLNTGWIWAFEHCTPCDPPTASHDTPAGKETAQAAAEPKPGDVVRLVREPTPNEYPHDSGRWEPNWGGSGDYMRVHYVGSNINGTRVVRAVFGLEWPLSCVEIVKGGE